MVKIVGKIWIHVFLFCVIMLDAAVLMEVRTETRVRNQVVIGQPFILDVIVDDVYGSIAAPTIAGLDHFNAKRTGMYMSSINGKSTTRYSYQVRIDVVGTYTIGPAVVHYQQQDFISNTITISVVKDATMPTSAAAQQNGNNFYRETKTFLRLMVDKDSVVVGQKIGCALRFYYQDPSLSLVNVGMPELSGFDVKTIGKLESGMAEVNGQEYRYAQWRWDMYPTNSGSYIIPAYNLDYEIPRKDNHALGGIFMFINHRAERKRIYSNAVSINVTPLPHFDGKVDGIGLFERFTAQVSPSVAKEGEGMVLALEVEGVGNLETMLIPKLTMPHALKYYDSNTAIIMPDNNDELPKKRFEFIVQGLQSGDWEIPEQTFTFFDVEKNDYVTLYTSPLSVSIMPGMNVNKKELKGDKSSVILVDQVSTNELMPINSVGSWYCIAEYKPLSWWIFFLLFFIPILYLCYLFLSQKFVLLSKQSRIGRRWRAFKLARKKVDQAIKSSQDKDLYVIFVQLFTCTVQEPIGDFSSINISTVMRDNDMSEEIIQEWNDFYECIMRAAYTRLDYKDNHQRDELCRMAKQWIDRLEKIL